MVRIATKRNRKAILVSLFQRRRTAFVVAVVALAAGACFLTLLPYLFVRVGEEKKPLSAPSENECQAGRSEPVFASSSVAGFRTLWEDFDRLVVADEEGRRKKSKGKTKSKVSGGVFLYPRQTLLLQNAVRRLLQRHARDSRNKGGEPLRTFRVCETGFGTGHSAALFVHALRSALEDDVAVTVELMSFDKFDRAYQAPAWNALTAAHNDDSRVSLLKFRGDSCRTVPQFFSLRSSRRKRCDVLHGSSLCPTDNVDLVAHAANAGALLTSTAMSSSSASNPVYFGPNGQWRDLRERGCVDDVVCFREAPTETDRDYVFAVKGTQMTSEFCMGRVTGTCVDDERDARDATVGVSDVLRSTCPDSAFEPPK